MRRLPLAALTFALGTLAATPAGASPEDLFGYAPRSSAMGQTGVAHAASYDAAYANPALLSRIREKKLTLGLQAATFALSARGDALPGRLSSRTMEGSLIGADLPIPFAGALKDRVGVGLAFYTPTDVIIRGRILYPETPQFPLVADRAQSLAVRLGVGVDVGYGLRVGAGFAALAEILGQVIVATDATGRVGSRVEDQLVATYAPIVGLAWDAPLGGLRVGLVFRGTLDARFSVELDATRLSSLNIPVLNISGIAQYDPAQVGLEIARERGGWVLAAGATFKRWSAFPGILEPIIRCPDPDECGALVPPKIAFSDTLSARAGVERAIPLSRAATSFFRGGAAFEPSPVPRSLPPSQAFDAASRGTVAVPTRFFDADRVVFSLGLGVTMKAPLPPIAVDTYAQLQLLAPRTMATEDGAGGATSAQLSGRVLAAGLTLGVKF